MEKKTKTSKPLETRLEQGRDISTNKRASLRSLKKANQLRKYNQLISQLEQGLEISPGVLATSLRELAELKADNQFRELINAYIDYRLNEKPNIDPKTNIMPITYSNRSRALQFIDYLCLAIDHGVDKLTKLDESEKRQLDIKHTQETLHRLFDNAPYAYR